MRGHKRVVDTPEKSSKTIKHLPQNDACVHSHGCIDFMSLLNILLARNLCESAFKNSCAFCGVCNFKWHSIPTIVSSKNQSVSEALAENEFLPFLRSVIARKNWNRNKCYRIFHWPFWCVIIYYQRLPRVSYQRRDGEQTRGSRNVCWI